MAMLTPAMTGAVPQAQLTVAEPPGTLPKQRAHERLRIHSANLNVLTGHAVIVTGRLRPSLPSRRIALRALRGGRWRTIAHTRTGAGGRFRLRYVAHRLGGWPVEVSFRGGPYARGAVARLGTLSSYRLAIASWYGGGGPLACGGYLTSATMGVANKTLPCGAWLTLRYGNRSVRVQVIDRGPYVAGREFDLTEATKEALGFAGVAPVWATR